LFGPAVAFTIGSHGRTYRKRTEQEIRGASTLDVATHCGLRDLRVKRFRRALLERGCVLPNLSVLWVIFFVLLLTFIVDRLLLRPVLEVIRKREEAIDSARELARRSAAEAEAATAAFDRETAAARAEIYREMDEMRRAAVAQRVEIVSQTRAEAEAAVASAARELQAEAEAARRRLDAEAQALGAAAAERILGRKAS
jgi:F-type H+-transporting ATPase subunit b